MNFELNHKGFESYLLERRPIPHLPSSIQYLFKFENGYGASVVKSPYSYGGEIGQWELGVIFFDAETDEWHLTYDTPVTNDVVGYLSDSEVRDLLHRIKKLK